MERLKMLGAAGGEVTGFSALATTNEGSQYLVDAGLFQGRGQGVDPRNRDFGNNDLGTVKAVFITHAHVDHTGRLPLLDKLYHYKGPVYMTPPTLPLTRMLLNNSCDLSGGQLYSHENVDRILDRVVMMPYNREINVDGISAVFRDARHILGSASLEMQEKGRKGEKIVFSGDIGNSFSRLARFAKPITSADLLVTEATYGDEIHPKSDPKVVIKEAVDYVDKTKGTIVIAAFALEKTQNLLDTLKEMRENGQLGNIPVILDGQMNIEATDTYKNYIGLLSDAIQGQKNPFNFSKFLRTYTSEDSRAIDHYRGPKIIIAGSGMMTGGRIMRHAYNYLPDPKSVFLFVGYPGENTLARDILEGKKEVMVGNYVVDVEAKVMRTGAFSSHADKEQIGNFIGSIAGIRAVIVTHGKNKARNELANNIVTEHGIGKVYVPDLNKEMDLREN